MYSKKELKEQEKEIVVLRYIFIPIFFICSIIIYFRDNSLKYIEKQYKKANQESFSGVVYKKVTEGEGHNPHHLYLNSGKRKQVDYIFYGGIQIGDSVVKRKKSDSVYYYKKNGKVIIEDENSYLRKRYLDKLKEK